VSLSDLNPIEGSDCVVGTARLGFDPAVSLHFHVFLLLEDKPRYLTRVYVYSSESGTWIYKENGSLTVFVNHSFHEAPIFSGTILLYSAGKTSSFV
jgi:hypothetical protein